VFLCSINYSKGTFRVLKDAAIRKRMGLTEMLIKHRIFYGICALLGCYAASSGNPLPTFRDNIPVPSSRVKKSRVVIRY
jgi:hypothetical protein